MLQLYMHECKTFAGVCKLYIERGYRLQTHQWVWRNFQRYNVVRIVVRVCLASALGLCSIGVETIGQGVAVHAQPASACSSHDDTGAVVRGGRVQGMIRHVTLQGVTWTSGTQDARSNIFSIRQRNCGFLRRGSDDHEKSRSRSMMEHGDGKSGMNAGKGNPALRQGVMSVLGKYAALVNARQAVVSQSVAAKQVVANNTVSGSGNTFPYGACTWWADQRYYQLHGVFVPWRSNANAWQWVARAHDFDWHVSNTPTVGSIIVLQSGVQGASGLGHVGIVESVLSNGSVIASSMNWGAHPSAVTDTQFHPGPGVSFVTQ